MKNRAIMFRSEGNKLLYDVYVINNLEEADGCSLLTRPLTEVILQKVQFKVASSYVEDYNSSTEIN